MGLSQWTALLLFEREKVRNMRRKVELLAPAGNKEAFYGAICAGADAVYLGGSRFGARAYAENFSEDDLIRCIRYAHLFDRKVYLTVNTLFKQSEIDELISYLAPFYIAGLDGVIVQDLGALRLIRENFPKMELHASTQMTLCSKFGAKLLLDLGAVRIVPARELTLSELSEIKHNTNLELETFIHGAMCYCYSGQCLFSSVLGGRSGNRGRCAQPCRLPYRVADSNAKVSKDIYPLSLKDMNTINNLPELLQAQIDSFKIEGRMKSAEYAAGVTYMYRKYIDIYLDLEERFGAKKAAECFRVAPEDLKNLSSLYIRSEVQNGYYFKRNGRDMITLNNPSYRGNDEQLLSSIREKYLGDSKKIPTAIKARFCTGKKAEVTFSAKDATVTIVGEVVQAAQKQPISEENVKKQLSKLGETFLFAESLEVSLSENAFYPLKQINEMRREAAEALEEKLLPLRKFTASQENFIENHDAFTENKACKFENSSNPGTGFSVLVTNIEQLKALHDWMLERKCNFERIYVEGDVIVFAKEEALPLLSSSRNESKIYFALPYILRNEDEDYLNQLVAIARNHADGILVRSMDGLGFCKDMGDMKFSKVFHLRADAGLYTWNNQAIEELYALGVRGFCVPYELNAREQHALLQAADFVDFEKIVYGRIPLMHSANCVQKTTGKCLKNKTGILEIEDRYHKKFPVMRNCWHCNNTIYNCVPLSLKKDLYKWKNSITLRLDFTLESATEMMEILDAFLFSSEMPVGEYTSGHEKRGVD